MAYTDFTFEYLKEKFQLIDKIANLFENTTSLEPNDWLNNSLRIGLKTPLRTEKARSEQILTPILLYLKDINNDFFNLYSGEILNADKSLGLYGECDFIITKNTHSYNIDLPIISVVEAKKKDIDLGIEQCTAQMIGSQIYNKNHSKDIPIIYGCVTTGDDWKFLKLENNIITIDQRTYYLSELKTILGIFQTIIDYYKSTLN